MVRELKYYKWVYDKNKIVLIDKRAPNEMVLSMAKADSFVRAYVSFKNAQRIEEKKVIRNLAKNQMLRLQDRVLKLKEHVAKLKTRTHASEKASSQEKINILQS